MPAVATLPTDQITPGVTDPSGSVIVTGSPLVTSDWLAASRLIDTTCRAEVAENTGPDAAPPSDARTAATRSARGSNTACPSGSVPVCSSPSFACNCSSPYRVSQEK